MKKDIPTDLAIGRICEYIDLHLAEELTYAHLREQLQITQYHLTGKFPRVMGTTLTNYIILQRLEQVITKVNNGEKLEDAVYGSGFRTYSHFYKEFRKNHGIAPKAYFMSKRKNKK